MQLRQSPPFTMQHGLDRSTLRLCCVPKFRKQQLYGYNTERISAKLPQLQIHKSFEIFFCQNSGEEVSQSDLIVISFCGDTEGESQTTHS